VRSPRRQLRPGEGAGVPVDQDLARHSDRVGETPDIAKSRTEADSELRRCFDALEALRRVTSEINPTLDLDMTLRVVLDEAVRFTAADAGLAVLFPQQGAELRAWQGYDGEALLEISRTMRLGRPPDEILADVAYASRRHVVRHRPGQHPGGQPCPTRRRRGGNMSYVWCVISDRRSWCLIPENLVLMVPKCWSR